MSTSVPDSTTGETPFQSCPGCLGNELMLLTHSFVAHWISKRIGKQQLAALKRCQTCSLHFFSYRYSQAENEKIYHLYRSNTYLKERQREEPFYTKKLNESFVSSQDYVEFRIEKCKTKVSQEVVGIDQVKTVLDYGGDRGQFIPRFTPEQRSYVFEISDHKTVADVTSIKDSSQLKQSKPDLVIISHVLEHVSEPRELLHEIFSQLAHENTFIYIEVPLDTPITRRTSSSNWNFRLQSFYSHHPFVSTIFDSVAKILLKTVHLDLPIKPFRQSEHINFFSEESLITLMKENDYSKVGNLDTYEYQISMTLKSSCLVGVFRRS